MSRIGSGTAFLKDCGALVGRTRKRVAGLFVVVLTVVALLGATSAEGAAFSASEMIRSGHRITLEPGQAAVFTIGFKNTGTRTWHRDGPNYISVYTHGPKYRKSLFADPSWQSSVQPVRVRQDSVTPGSIGWFSFTLRAPAAAGTYLETFHVAAEDLLWMPGGEFAVEIEVGSPSVILTPARQTVPVPSTPSVSDTVPTAAQGFHALKMIVSDRQMRLDANTEQTFRVGFKNVGDAVWRRSGGEPVTLRALAGNSYSFRHPSWTEETVTGLPTEEILPGQLAFFTVKLRAPAYPGSYTPRFILTAGQQFIEGGMVELPVEVMRGQVPAQVPSSYDEEFSRSGPRGPNIRIGLFSPDDISRQVTLTATGPYRLMDSADNTVTTLSGVTGVTFDLASRTYTVRNGTFQRQMTKYLYFEPLDGLTVFEITSYERRAAWDSSYNFNRFRGKIEIFYTSNTGRLWVVEELPMEDYLRGLAETTNASPPEFQKALVTAARTYALFVVSIGGKHKNEFFDLDTTGNDQVYKGYVSELIRPNVVKAVEDTRGTVVTYNGDIVVTPYFSRSDGRTRAWTEVWSSTPHPWLVSVPTPYDQGKTLWGHGVGMAASDAVGRAADGATWDQILKHYYTGVELKRIY